MRRVIVILFFALMCIVSNFQQNELEFVAIIFRHGDKTPEFKSTYPKDVHKNLTFGIHGPGELTNQGRRRIYLLGKQLKKMYEKYLGGNFTINNVRAVSTDYKRAKDSLELVLNALFDDNEGFDNLKHFNYEIAFVRNNTLLSFPFLFCLRYQQLYIQYEQSEGIKIQNKYVKWFPYISEHTGVNVTTMSDLIPIYESIQRDAEFGLNPPIWLSDVKDCIVSAILDQLASTVASSELNRLFGGFLLREILNNIDIQIKTSKKQILHLYSAHDLNIVGLLGAMNTFHPHVPVYAACLVVKLHKIRNSYYVKVLYQQNVTIGFKEIDLPGCSALCPLEMFKDIVQENISDETDSCF